MEKEGSYKIVLGRSKSAIEKFGMQATVLIAKQYVKMLEGSTPSQEVYLDLDKAHVVFVCGKRGTGKCLAGSSLVTLADGRVRRIDELEVDCDVLSLGEKLKIHSRRKEGFYKRTVQKLLRVTLRSGKQVELTPEHPLLTLAGWRETGSLDTGDRIATPRVSPAFGNESMPEERVKLLAYLIAEGHLSNGFVLFSNMDEKIVRDFYHAVEVFDPSLRIEQHSKPGCYRVAQRRRRVTAGIVVRNSKGQFINAGVKVSRGSLREWLEREGLYGKLSRTKFIPDCIFILPRQQLALFLNRLFSCDGTIYERHGAWIVAYCSASRQLIMQVHHLLLRFGILSRVRHRPKVDAYELIVNPAHTALFCSDIGFYGRKELRQKRALVEAVEVIHNPNVDTVPKELWEVYRPQSWAATGRGMGYAHPKALRESIRYAPSRQKLLQMARIDGDVLAQYIAQSDVFWDEIRSIEELQGEFTVYDISVPGDHNFIANDVIVHNSYSMGAIAEGIADSDVAGKLSVIIFDTMGIYWTMKYPNHKPDEERLLKAWGLEGKGFGQVKVFTPARYHREFLSQGEAKRTDAPFSIRPSELGPEDWLLALDVVPGSHVAAVVERVILRLKEARDDFSVEDIIRSVNESDEDVMVKRQVMTRFDVAARWGLFSERATPMAQLAKGGQVTVIDLSMYAQEASGWKIKSLALGFVAQKLFKERMRVRAEEEYEAIHSTIHYILEEHAEPKKLEMPLVWMFVDEAHEFLPGDGRTGASDARGASARDCDGARDAAAGQDSYGCHDAE